MTILTETKQLSDTVELSLQIRPGLEAPPGAVRVSSRLLVFGSLSHSARQLSQSENRLCLVAYTGLMQECICTQEPAYHLLPPTIN